MGCRPYPLGDFIPKPLLRSGFNREKSSLHRVRAHVLQLDAEHLGNTLFLHRHTVKAVTALHRALSMGDDDELRIL